MCIQCKLTIQVESKHKKDPLKEKKTSSNQVGELEGKKKGGKRQVIKPKILFITLFMSLFALFIYRKKKSTNRWLGKNKNKK